MQEIKTKLMITKKYLEQLYEECSKQLDADVKSYDLDSAAGNIRVDTLGKISQAIRDIQSGLQQIEDSISLAEDMEKGLKVR